MPPSSSHFRVNPHEHMCFSPSISHVDLEQLLGEEGVGHLEALARDAHEARCAHVEHRLSPGILQHGPSPLAPEDRTGGHELLDHGIGYLARGESCDIGSMIARQRGQERGAATKMMSQLQMKRAILIPSFVWPACDGEPPPLLPGPIERTRVQRFASLLFFFLTRHIVSLPEHHNNNNCLMCHTIFSLRFHKRLVFSQQPFCAFPAPGLRR